MTSSEKEEIKGMIVTEVAKVPDAIIKRLDDRYLQKDTASTTYLTRFQGAIVGTVLTIIVIALGIFDWLLTR